MAGLLRCEVGAAPRAVPWAQVSMQQAQLSAEGAALAAEQAALDGQLRAVLARQRLLGDRQVRGGREGASPGWRLRGPQ